MAQQDDDLVEGTDLLDPGSHEYLCPVCRRLGTTLLPAITPLPPSSSLLPRQAGGAAPSAPDQAMQQQEGHTDAQTNNRLGQMDQDRVEDSDTVGIPTGPWGSSAVQSELEGFIVGLLPSDTTHSPSSGEQETAQIDRRLPSAEHTSGSGMGPSEEQTTRERWGEFSSLASGFVSHAQACMCRTARGVAQQGQLEVAEDQATAETNLDQGSSSSEDEPQQGSNTISSPAAAGQGDANTHMPRYKAWHSIYGNSDYNVTSSACKAQLLWSIWAHNVVSWEVQHRPGGVCTGSDAKAVSNAQWRGMQAMAALCLAHGTGSPRFYPPANPHSLLSAQLRWLTATDTVEDHDHSSSFRPSLRPLLRLPLRSSTAQPDSGHALFSTAENQSRFAAAPTDPSQAGPHPPAGPAPSTTEPERGQTSRRHSNEGAATTSEAACGISGTADHSSSNHNPSSSTDASHNLSAADTLMSGAAGDDLSMGHHASSSHMHTGQPAATARLWQATQSGPGSSSQPESQGGGGKRKMGAHTIARRQEVHPERDWQGLIRDPFALLMHLFALVLSPQGSTDSGSMACLPVPSAAAEGDRVVLFQALVRLVYVIATAQAAHFTSTSLTGTASPAQVRGVLAPLLIPLLQRAHIVMCLITSASASEARSTLPFCQQGKHKQLDGPQAPDPAAAVQMLQDQLSLPEAASVLVSLLSCCKYTQLHHRWVTFPGILPLQQSLHQGMPVLRSPALMHLPHHFQELFLHQVGPPCGGCGRPPKEGALCLQCGAFMCAGDPTCRHPNQGGYCRLHALACGGGTCAFLLMKMTKVLLISASRACLAPSPYLDSHGEEDLYLNRGRPLYLNQQRLLRLSQLWVASAFDFDSPTFHDAFGGSAWRAAQYW